MWITACLECDELNVQWNDCIKEVKQLPILLSSTGATDTQVA